jgi:hypothetical protein
MKSCIIVLSAVIFFALLLSSCSDFTDDYHYDVAPALKIHVDAFYAEARKRGFELPTDGLSVRLTHHTDNNVGDCETGTRIITLDQDFVQRQQHTGYRADSLWVQYVVFHELGHGLLLRDHCGGESIMNAHNEHINPYSGIETVRQRMINELFAPYRP